MIGFLIYFSLWGSIIAFLIASILWLISLFLSERYKNGFVGLFCTIIFSALLFQGSNIDYSFITWTNFGLYIGIGFVHALLRTYLFGIDIKKKIKDKFVENTKNENLNHRSSEKTILEIESNYARMEIKESFFRWWLMFPISFMYWLFSDLAIRVYDKIYNIIQKFVYFLFNLGLGKIEVKENLKK